MSPNRRAALLLAGIALLAFAAVVLWVLRLGPSGERDGVREPAVGLAERVRLDAPAPDSTVISPLIVTGTAPGPWFFEATFPVRLLDADGASVADTFAEARGEWMTEEPVAFRAVLDFPPPPTAAGILVLERANPSGLPEHADSVRVPVRFAATTLRIFLPNSARDPERLDCRRVHPVERRVPPGVRLAGPAREFARAAVEELLAGPTPEEREAGYLTSLPERATLRSVRVTDGVARADFGAGLQEGVAGSCRVLAIRSQIEQTLLGIPGVRRAVISVEGRAEEALQP